MTDIREEQRHLIEDYVRLQNQLYKDPEGMLVLLLNKIAALEAHLKLLHLRCDELDRAIEQVHKTPEGTPDNPEGHTIDGKPFNHLNY